MSWEWSRKKFGNLTRCIEKTRREMDVLSNVPQTSEVIHKYHSLGIELDQLLLLGEHFWRQRS